MNNTLAIVVASAFSFLAPAGDNPEFDYWVGHKAGSWVKIKMEMEAQGVKIAVDATHTLLEVAGDKCVVERKMKVSAPGQDPSEQTEKEDVVKDKDKDPVTITKEGDEEIEVAGKKMKCHWIEGTQKETRKVKFWLSKEIPGGIAKGEASGGDIPSVMKLSAQSWEKK